MFKKYIMIVIALSLMACQHSPRKEHYALSATAANFDTNELRPVNLIVGVGPVNLPEYLHHNKIAYWKTAQQLVLLDNQYWAEPLDRGITRVLALELQAQQPQWRVVQFPWMTNQRPNYSLKVDIQRLDAFTDYTVLELNVDWIDLNNKKVTNSQTIKLRRDSSANAASIAEAISLLLQEAARAVKAPALPGR